MGVRSSGGGLRSHEQAMSLCLSSPQGSSVQQTCMFWLCAQAGIWDIWQQFREWDWGRRCTVTATSCANLDDHLLAWCTVRGCLVSATLEGYECRKLQLIGASKWVATASQGPRSGKVCISCTCVGVNEVDAIRGKFLTLSLRPQVGWPQVVVVGACQADGQYRCKLVTCARMDGMLLLFAVVGCAGKPCRCAGRPSFDGMPADLLGGKCRNCQSLRIERDVLQYSAMASFVVLRWHRRDTLPTLRHLCSLASISGMFGGSGFSGPAQS
jgi:hypothetical protein